MYCRPMSCLQTGVMFLLNEQLYYQCSICCIISIQTAKSNLTNVQRHISLDGTAGFEPGLA